MIYRGISWPDFQLVHCMKFSTGLDWIDGLDIDARSDIRNCDFPADFSGRYILTRCLPVGIILGEEVGEPPAWCWKDTG